MDNSVWLALYNQAFNYINVGMPEYFNAHFSWIQFYCRVHNESHPQYRCRHY